MNYTVCRICHALHLAEEKTCLLCGSHLGGFPYGWAEAKRTDGGFLVSRHFTNEAAAQRGMNLLLSVNEEAFAPVTAYDAHPGSLNLPSNEDGS